MNIIQKKGYNKRLDRPLDEQFTIGAEGLITISFVAHGQPFLETVVLHNLSENLIELENISSSKRDRAPWITCVTSGKINLRSISITASAQKSAADDDDLQLRINGEKIKNQDPLSHRDWYWCGKVLRGQNVEYKKEFREQKNYVIELWADNTPTIKRFMCVFEKNLSDKPIPTVDKPRWTGDFHDDSDQIILARAIFGEGRNLPEIGRVAIGWLSYILMAGAMSMNCLFFIPVILFFC